MELTLIETFIVNAVAERRHNDPKMPHYQAVLSDITRKYGSFPNIPGYSQLERMLDPYVALLTRQDSTVAESGAAARKVAATVKAFVQDNSL